LREQSRHSLDSVAFHYSVYRALSRILGMDGNLQVAYDTTPNFFDVWTTMGKTNDFLNAETGEFDPRHMFGISNFDVFRWPSLVNGTQKQMLGTFINSLLMPGIPLVSLLLDRIEFRSHCFIALLWRRARLLPIRQRRVQLPLRSSAHD
jgi:alpha-1,3-glucan synthase